MGNDGTAGGGLMVFFEGDWLDQTIRVSRQGNPETSFAAEKSINESGSRQTHAKAILTIVRNSPGMTTGEVGDASGLGQMETRKRLSDLRNAYLLYAGSSRVWPESGRQHSTWWPMQAQGRLC